MRETSCGEIGMDVTGTGKFVAVGYTYEGCLITSGSPSFCPFSLRNYGFPRFILQLSVKSNKDAKGKRKPYLVLNLFGILLQSGWLFG